MAAQVNKKFVIILSAVIATLVFAAVIAGGLALKNNGGRHATRGEKLIAEGNFEEAYKAYARAVNKDQTNVEWLTAYRDLALKTKPNTREELDKRYRLYLGTLRNLAIAQPNNPQALLDFLNERQTRLSLLGWNPDGTKEFIEECKSMPRMLRQRVEAGNASEEEIAAIEKIDWYLAQAGLELSRNTQVEEYERLENRKAIEAIIEKHPDNVDAQIYLGMWHVDEADGFYSKGLKQQETEQRDEAARIFENILTRFPDNLFARLMDLARRQADIGRTITEPGARRRAVEGLTPYAQQALAAFNNTPPDDITLRLMESSRTLLPRVLGKEASQQMLDAAERAALKKSDDPWIALTYARMLMDAEQYDKAVSVLDGVLNQPKMSVSLAATLQPIAQIAAFGERVDASLFAAERAENKQEWIKRADEYMKQFEAAASADDAASVKLRRAKVAMMNENYASAIRDLSDLEQLGLAEAVEIKYMIGVCLFQQGNFGGARDKLASIVTSGNFSLPSISLLADAQIRLNEFENAKSTLQDAIRVFPASAEPLQEKLNTVLAAMGENVQLNPSAAAMLAARKARVDGDIKAARSLITEAIKNDSDNARLAEELIQIELADNNRAEAKRLADIAVAKWPDLEQFKQLEIFARVEDENQAMLEWIEKSSGSPAEKALQRYATYMRMNDEAAAERELAAAEKAEPDNRIMINERFSRALIKEDFETARRYAAKAASLNIDNLDGALFQGRLEMARGEFGAAVATFQAATKRIPHSTGAWSYLGDAQMAAGQVDGAVDSYKKAIDLRPGDADIAMRFARALLRVGRGPEALAVLTDVLRISPQRGQVYDLWISLQGAYGDRDDALAQRATLFERDPMVTENSVSYFALLLEDKQWKRAEQVLAKIESDPNVKKITLTDMRAKLLADQGDVEGGVNTYKQYLAGLAGNATALDQIGYGQFLQKYERFDEAIEAFRNGRALQAEGNFDADIALANMLITRSNTMSTQIDVMRATQQAEAADQLNQERTAILNEAAQAMKRIIDAGGDDPANGLVVHRSYAVVLADLEQYDEAERFIAKVAAIAPEKDADLQVTLLRARIAGSKNDLREARRILDQAVAKHPGNFEPYWQRAQLNRDDPALVPGVLRDLAKVTSLRPGMTEAWGLWFDLLREQGQLTEALASLRNGVAVNPGVRELRQFLIYQLLDVNRVSEAQEVAMEGTRQKPDRAYWLRTASELYARSNLWQQVLPLRQQLYDLEKSTENAIIYLDAVLRQQNPTPGVVQQLLAALPPDNEMDLRTVMVASRGRAFFKQTDRSRSLARLGWNQIVADERTLWTSMAFWLGQAALAEGSVSGALQLAQGFDPTFEQAIPLLILSGNQLMAEGERPDIILSRITRLDEVELDPVSKFELLRLRAKLFYLDSPIRDFEKSASFNMQALEINPDALDVNNDLAYTLAEDLKRPADALPYAQKAESLSPDAPTVLDTLGWVYHRLGRNEDAARTLKKAADRAQGRDNSDEFIALVHLAIVTMEMGDARTAREIKARAETLIKLDPSIKNYYPTALDELRAAVN
ncbi:MAG: tetratricopeptide repeat protein [Phycisphaerales bacterium]